MPRTVVVQYVPDSVMDERINVGVIVVDDGRTRSLFLDNWQRVKQFSGKDVSFLKGIARDSRDWDEATVNRLVTQWTGSVQFSKPSFTTLPIDEALLDSAKRYLFERSAETQGYRNKAAAVQLVRRRIREKLIEKIGTAGRALIKGPTYELRGQYSAYQFDVSVGNGEPYFAAQGLSFEVPNTRHLEKGIASTAWLVEDVKRITPDFPIGIAVLPPKRDADRLSQDNYEEALNIFRQLNAEVILERDFSVWADRVSEETLPRHLFPRHAR
jgi:hypothetical protein